VKANRVCPQKDYQYTTSRSCSTDVNGKLEAFSKFAGGYRDYSRFANKGILFGLLKINDPAELDILGIYKEAYCISNAEKKLKILKSYEGFKDIVHKNSVGILKHANTAIYDAPLQNTNCQPFLK
jgi:hypothetical protein